MSSELIPMLTYNDETVDNAMEIFKASKDAPTKFWGFKDVGLPKKEMKQLVELMKDKGKTTFLEGVRYSKEDCMSTAELAIECNFDYLMGTVYHDEVNELLQDKSVDYFPFCGTVVDHPSVLKGSIQEMVQEGKKFQKNGVDGIDLLAYRHTDTPEELAKEFVNSVNLPVVVAGSISSFKQLDFIKEIEPFAFTIGTALFDNKFAEEESFSAQIEKVVEYLKT